MRPPRPCPCCSRDHAGELGELEALEREHPATPADLEAASRAARALFEELLASEEPMHPAGGVPVAPAPVAVGILR